MDQSLDNLFGEAIKALARAISGFGGTSVVIGGVAVGLLSVPRATKDVDALIIADTANLDSLAEALSREGLLPLFSDAVEFARQSRILPLRHEPSGVRVDLALGCMPFEEGVIERSRIHQIGDVPVRLPIVEDLVILKAIANRDQDRADIHRIAEMNPGLDMKHIRYWVNQYGELLETPGLWSDIKPLLETG